MSVGTAEPALYRERLSVPIRWWVLAGLLALAMLVAIGVYLGPVWGAAVGLAAVAIATGVFVSAATVLVVERHQLSVGRSVLEHRYIGSVRALTPELTRQRADLDADARAHLVLRPYIATSVELTLDDPADPVPYWLVSTRRPGELAAALQRAGVADAPDPSGSVAE